MIIQKLEEFKQYHLQEIEAIDRALAVLRSYPRRTCSFCGETKDANIKNFAYKYGRPEHGLRKVCNACYDKYRLKGKGQQNANGQQAGKK